MRKMILAAMAVCSPAILFAQATNLESSGAPATAQQGSAQSGSARSMPQGNATMQNDTPTGQAGMSTGGQTAPHAVHSRTHHKSSATSGMSGGSPS